MKKLSSIFFMIVGAITGLITVLLMNAPLLSADGTTLRATNIYWNSGANSIHGVWFAFLGFMLILAAAIALIVLALPVVQPSIKVEKIVLISTLSAFVVGTVLVLISPAVFAAINPVEVSNVALEPGWVIILIFMALTITCNVIAMVKDW